MSNYLCPNAWYYLFIFIDSDKFQKTFNLLKVRAKLGYMGNIWLMYKQDL